MTTRREARPAAIPPLPPGPLRSALEAHARASASSESAGRESAGSETGSSQVLAGSERGRTTRVPWDGGGEVVVKETRGRAGLLGALAGALRPSRARRAFEASRALARAGVPVAAALDLVEEGASAWLVLAHVPGERLDAALVRALESHDTARVLEIALDAVDLAARIHAAGVAHGDLKPANVVVDSREPRRLVALDLDGALVGDVSHRARAKDLAALDAYGQRGTPRVPRRVRLEAFEHYVARAGLGPDEARRVLRAVVARSLWKRARWRSAGA